MIDYSKYSMSKYVTKEQRLQDIIRDLQKENRLLLQRLHTSKRDNRVNRDRLRDRVDRLSKHNDELLSKLRRIK